MPQVNWEAFGALPGNAQINFEMLCRGLIRRHYGKFGDFRALASQPGVEFHLQLKSPCQLGDAGRWYGWQCRWYDLPGGRAIGSARKNKIVDALRTTENILPGITDWVLWTRRPLTKGDQDWFSSLETDMRLHLWTGGEVEEHLSGDAEILRSTYFGELVLTPDVLAALHKVSVAPIQRRWNPLVHQVIDAERDLRRMLGEPGAWNELRVLGEKLAVEAKSFDSVSKNLEAPLANMTVALSQTAHRLAGDLSAVSTTLDRGDLDYLRQQLVVRKPVDSQELSAVLRRLRGSRHVAALIATNMLAKINDGSRLLNETANRLNERIVAVLADAGCGKSELAAQLTVAVGDRPAGVLLHGGNLHAAHNLGDLAHSVVVNSASVANMESLIAAVDAAGQRAHRRLPIVIDGLNEAEDPRRWKSLLASLDVTLSQYSYVLVVCTLRNPFDDQCIPSEFGRLKIAGFEHDTIDAIQKYFAFYRINAADVDLPLELLRHPLTLRLFCEVTNPKRDRDVGVESIPTFLTGLFDRYLDQASERISELAPHSRLYYPQDVRAALDEIGWALWVGRTRTLDTAELRRSLFDDSRMWGESIVRALEQEGILIRVPADTSTSGRVAPVYDALGGHLVAHSIVAKLGRDGFRAWIHDPINLGLLVGPLDDQHPLSADIFKALSGVVPRKLNRQQLWPLLDDDQARTSALLCAANIEGAYLDAETVGGLAALFNQDPASSLVVLDRLWRTRGSPAHPLNAEFLDTVLRPMPVAHRDLRWTEWTRGHANELIKDLQRLEQRWRRLKGRSPSDLLRAKWVKWALTSTFPRIRDQATRTLYWFGRGRPSALFGLAVDGLGINDSYVPERLLAASYGVAIAHQQPDPGFEKVFGEYLAGLRDALTGGAATHPTNHWLARLYVQGCVSLGAMYHPGAVPESLRTIGSVSFSDGPAIRPIGPGEPGANEADRAFNSHYEEDTLSQFVGFRAHGSEHAAVAYLRGTLWALGWREAELGIVDNNLPTNDYRRDQALAGRYAMKYAWIGLYTYPRMLEHYGRVWDDRRPPDVQIDPSFPKPSPIAPFSVPSWAGSLPEDDRRWVSSGAVTAPDELFCVPNILGHSGPWLAAYGYLSSRSKVPDRGVFGFLNALLVEDADADKLLEALSAKEYPGNRWLPDAPEEIYTFSGEIPWHPDFARESSR